MALHFATRFERLRGCDLPNLRLLRIHSVPRNAFLRSPKLLHVRGEAWLSRLAQPTDVVLHLHDIVPRMQHCLSIADLLAGQKYWKLASMRTVGPFKDGLDVLHLHDPVLD